MKPVKITDKIYWVGAIDWDLRDFHGYTTERGSTYNSYLILTGGQPLSTLSRAISLMRCFQGLRSL